MSEMTTTEAREKRKADFEAKMAMITRAAIAACGTFTDVMDYHEVSDEVKFYITNPDATAVSYHDQWVERMKRANWANGSVFDEERRLDPRIVSFFWLPRKLQLRAHLIRGIVKALDR